MEGTHYAELSAFIAIYDARSFRDAALRLNVTPSALSRTLRRLETRLGARLLNRTTRSVSPTEAGTSLYAKIVPAIAQLDEAVSDAVSNHGAPVGSVRLNVPRLAAELILMPNLSRFKAMYPALRLEIVIDDALTDVVAKGFDAGIRIGEKLAQDMIAARLTPPMRVAIVGSPSYFADNEPPVTPNDLSAHACINYRWADTGQLFKWSFSGPNGPLEVDVQGPMTINDTGLIRDAAVSDLGLAYLPEAAVSSHILEGRLIRVLEDWCPPIPGFYLYHPSRYQTPPGLRALISFLQAAGRTS